MPGIHGPPERGVSEIIGVVLLFGLVMAGVAVVIVTGTVAKDGMLRQNEARSAEVAMTELDGQLGTITEQDETGVARFDVGARDPGTTTVGDEDTLSIRVNGAASCSTTLNVDGITYRTDDGTAYTYQAGAVWETTESGTSMVTPPEIRYEDGAIDVTALDVVGTDAGDGDFTLKERSPESARATREANRALFSGPECYRPQTVTVRVHSYRFHAQWAGYFRQEFPDSAEVTHSPGVGNVTLELDLRELPVRANDSANHVVDFTSDDDLGVVEDVDGDGNDEVYVDKGAGVEYDGSVKFLDAHVGYEKTIWRTDTVWNNTTRVINGSEERPPLDVVLLVDRSGSMEEPPAKIIATKAASKQFVEWLLEKDRVAVTSFGDDYHLRQSLTRDRTAAKSAIETIPVGGNTYIGTAIEGAHDHLLAEGNDSHRQVIVFLSDGNGDDSDFAALDAVEAAHADDITVHTIALGGGADEGLISEMAVEGGGEFHDADDVDELEDVFEEIAGDVSGKITTNESKTVTYADRRIVHNPVQMEMSVGGTATTPWVGPGPIAENSLNYPHDGTGVQGFRVEDGDVADFRKVTVWECDGNVTTGDSEAPPWNASKVYNHTRCTDAGGVKRTSTDVEVFHDGDAIPDSSTKWWQDDVPATMPARYVADADGDGTPDEFDLDSNQVVLVFRMNDMGTTDDNNVVALYEVGDAQSEAKARWVINVAVSKVDLRND